MYAIEIRSYMMHSDVTEEHDILYPVDMLSEITIISSNRCALYSEV